MQQNELEAFDKIVDMVLEHPANIQFYINQDIIQLFAESRIHADILTRAMSPREAVGAAFAAFAAGYVLAKEQLAGEAGPVVQ